MGATPLTANDIHAKFVLKVEDGVTTATPLWKRLKSSGKIEGGLASTTFQSQLETGTIGVGTMDTMSAPEATVPNLLETVTWTAGGYLGQYFLPDVEKKIHDGPNWLSGKSLQAQCGDRLNKDFQLAFETAWFGDDTTSTPPGWGGFGYMFVNSGTVAGKDVGTTTGWKVRYIDASVSLNGQTFSQAPAMHILNAIFQTQNVGLNLQGGPDLGVTTNTVLMGLAMKINNGYQRIVSYEDRAKFGATSVELSGVPFYWSPACSSGNIYLLDTSTLGVRHVGDSLLVDRSGTAQVPMGTYHQTWTYSQIFCESLRRNARLVNVTIS